MHKSWEQFPNYYQLIVIILHHLAICFKFYYFYSVKYFYSIQVIKMYGSCYTSESIYNPSEA